jgi:hypothetical protein
MEDALTHWYDRNHGVTDAFNAGTAPNNSLNNYSLDGIGSMSIGAFVGIAAWYFTSGLMLHNFGDSGWRKAVSNIAPLPIALAAGIFAMHLTSDVSDKGFTKDVWGQAVMETGKTISDYTGLGQASFTRAVLPAAATQAASPAPSSTAPRILPTQP